jgi:hypothetical protein
VTEAITEATSLDSLLQKVLYLSSIEEVVEHVQAADTLGLGFRVESYNVTSAEDQDGTTEYEFTLLSEQPVHIETDI